MQGHIPLIFHYNPQALEVVRKVEGRRWDPARKVWWIPNERIFEVACRLDPVLPSYANRLRKSPRFAEAREEASHALITLDASRATDSDLDIPCPEGESYLPFQKGGIAYAVEGERDAVLFGDEPGLGKTIQAVGVANYKGYKKILIICPASLKINWYRELGKWLMTTRKINILYSQTGPRVAHVSDVLIINYDILDKWKDILLKEEWDYVIVDEAHYIKNEKAKRSKATIELSDKAGYRAYITGTPIVNKPKELWNLLNGLDPETWNDWWWFARRYCDAHRDSRGNWNAEGASNLPELQQKLRETIMVRRLKIDVLKDLPPKRRQLIEISPSSAKHFKALEAEKKARAQFEAALKEVENASLSAAKSAIDKAIAHAHELREELSEEAENKFRNAVKRLNQARFAAFEELARIRHMTALAKVDDVIAFAKEALESTEKVVIFAHHHDVMDALMDAFGSQAVCVRGGMSGLERQRSVDRFQEDSRIRVFIGGMYAAGVGLTLTAASTVIFAELDWVPGIISQSEDRCHRIGQKDCVVVYHIVLQDSLDYKLAHTIVTKLEVIEAALDKQVPAATAPE